MAGVTYDGADIAPSSKSGHVSFGYRWRSGRDEDGNPEYDYGSGTATAHIEGTVSADTSNVFVNGNKIAKKGDRTSERWSASVSPPRGSLTYVNPGTSDSGEGAISTGNSSRVYVGGVEVALKGSSVRTMLSTNTTVSGGSDNVFVGG